MDIRKPLASALFLAAAALPLQAMAQGQASNLVLLRVNDAGSALEYNAPGSSHGVCQTPGQGCVRVSGSGQITFRLVSDRRCGSGAMWTLTGVQLGGEDATGKPGAWGGLSSTAASDFQADAGSGWVTTSAAPGGGVTVQDANSAAYSIWYRVEAECDGMTIEFDPRFENDGTGNFN